MRKTTLKEKVNNQIKSLKFEFRNIKDKVQIYQKINDRMTELYLNEEKSNEKQTIYIPKKCYKKASVIAFNIDKKISF
jgi:hypothetical protein